MKLGIYTECLHGKSLTECLRIVAELGLTSVAVNAGGYLPSPHLPVDTLLADVRARRDYLAQIADAGLELTALNVSCNPLHPHPILGPAHAADLHRAIELAGLLKVPNVVTLSGLPSTGSVDITPAWMVQPWGSAATKMLAHQWDDTAVPFWRDVESRARRSDVRVCIKMHPYNLVYNPATLVRLIERTNATHIGAEMDPSHLFWQGMEPIIAIEYLGDRVFNAAAKDARINTPYRELHGVLGGRYTPPGANDPRTVLLGDRYLPINFAQQPPWQFVAVGRAHDTSYWRRFLLALHANNPDIVVNIEHEDDEVGLLDGLEIAVGHLREAGAGIVD
ncbi:sugar phosphate isomerase/epimerase family protein [Streptomyces puniciscabiei]